MSCSQSCYDQLLEKDLESAELIDSELDWRIVKMIRIKDQSIDFAGSVDRLKELYFERAKTLFDINLSTMNGDELSAALLKCSISLIGGKIGKTDDNIDIFKMMIPKQDQMFLVQFVEHMMNVCRKTQFSLNIFDDRNGQFEKIGNCLLPFGGLLNHSCDPNIFWISANGKFIFIVGKPISAGEQLFICYR